MSSDLPKDFDPPAVKRAEMVRDLLAAGVFRISLAACEPHISRLLEPWMLHQDSDTYRSALDSTFCWVDSKIGRPRIDKFSVAELGHLQAWIRNEQDQVGGIRHHTYADARQVWRHFTNDEPIDVRLTADDARGAYRIETAALVWAFNNKIGVGRSRFAKALARAGAQGRRRIGVVMG